MNDITRKLEVLYDLLVDNSNTLEAELIELIANPDGVEDTSLGTAGADAVPQRDLPLGKPLEADPDSGIPAYAAPGADHHRDRDAGATVGLQSVE